MAERVLTPILKTYAELRRGVEAALLTGQREIERAKVRTYWEAGRLISDHLRLNEDRADYGAQIVPRLARDLGVSDAVLYRAIKFARSFPILAARQELSWAHYRVLILIEDSSQRKALAADAVKHGWTSRELEARIRPLRSIEATPDAIDGATPGSEFTRLLAPRGGTPGVYRIASINGALVVDLGFACYLDVPAEQADRVKAGALVQLDGNISPAEGATKEDLFTYRAELLRVIDGDTFWVKIYLRPRQWVKQKLRLRGLDCPELTTPEGKAAKRFVDALIAKTTAVTINTTKPDKYDRYLADVFLTADAGELFLNNELLENGQAVRKDAWQFRDWEPDLLA